MITKSNRRGLTNRHNGLNALMAVLLWPALSMTAAIPSPEKLLPDDTLVMVTVPDFTRLKELFKASPQSRLWNDPAMKPFRDKFVAKWTEEFVKPLERELNVRFEDYTSLPQGQVTFAVTLNGAPEKEDQPPGLLLLVDCRERSPQLKTNLTDLRKKWVDSGRPVKTEKIGNYEFSTLAFSSNDVPGTLRKFFPQKQPVQELGSDSDEKKTTDRTDLIIGQAESLLILGNSVKAIEKVVGHLSGSSAPSLGEQAAFEANRQAFFRDTPLYAWANVKIFVDLIARAAAEKKSSDTPDPFGNVSAEKVFSATGLAGLRTVAFAFQTSNEGSLMQFFVGAPESGRQGIFKILAGEAKDSNPPEFVPAEAVKFQRWRLDGQKTYATLEKMLNDISPQMLGALNSLIDTANTSAKEKDPGFDVKKSLITNLGDDLISYEKGPKGASAAQLRSPPSLFLVGSPHPEQLAAALKSIFGFLNQQGGAPSEREFLGRKIFSAPVPNLPLPIPTAAKPQGPRTIHFAASGGYVALSMDTSMLEEFLRSSESHGKSLRETPGLMEAAQKVTGPGTGLFGYQNQMESMRTAFDLLKKDPSSSTNGSLSSLPSALGVARPEASFQDWIDFSLLPSYDRISKYFYFLVYGGGANVQGLTLKIFAPTPPQLRAAK